MIILKAYITHVAVYTADLERMKEFYVKYFCGAANQKYQNNSGFSSYFLTFENDVRLEIMSHEQLEFKEAIEKVNGISHIAFSVGSKENVLELTNLLVSDGYQLLSPPRKTGDGYFESCISDPDGNRIEITE